MYYQQGQLDDLLGPIESTNVRFGLTLLDTPTLSWPVARFINTGAATPDTPRAVAYNRIDFKSYQGGFFVAQELPLRMTLQSGDLLSLGRNLLERAARNAFLPGTNVRPFPAFGLIDFKFSGSTANFHAWQTTLQRRFANGWLMGAQYQLGKTEDDGAGGSNEASYPQDLQCRSCEKAPGNFDVRHNFTFNYAYELPFGKGKAFLQQGVANWILGGWQLSGITTARTGRPVNVLVNRRVDDVIDGYTGVFSTTQRPNLVSGAAVVPENQGINSWINPAAFTAPARFQRGTLGRNVLYGPGLFQIDLGLTKRVAITERVGVIFRAEAFNIVNRANFGQPNATLNVGGTAAAPTLAVPGAFGRIASVLNSGATGSGGARALQFMLRLEF
jgi:hypothetical protein